MTISVRSACSGRQFSFFNVCSVHTIASMELCDPATGGLQSYVRNLHSKNAYMVSSGLVVGMDYWTTVVFSVRERQHWFSSKSTFTVDGEIASLTRNSKQEAHQVHAVVRQTVIMVREAQWIENFPSPSPPDGFSPMALQKLRSVLGDTLPLGVREKLDENEENSKEIVDEFARIVGEHSEPVLDAKLLPWPKTAIRKAFQIQLQALEEMKRMDREPFASCGLQQDIDKMYVVFGAIDDFWEIEPSDIWIVKAMNAKSPDVWSHEETMILAKYVGRKKLQPPPLPSRQPRSYV